MSEDLNVKRESEIEKNLTFFLSEMPNIAVHSGKFALIRHQKIVGYFDTPMDAVSAGNTAFNDGLFSIQQVTSANVDLGFYSYALHLGNTQQLTVIHERGDY